ncbi:MAG: hypothetical protein HY681_15420 [Chloroflexi bacterium]|nr:hypothetical protein [Chloroflexota bacterium]
MERALAPGTVWQRLPLASLSGLFALGSAAMHLLVMPEHFQEWWGYGVFFLALAILQGAYGLGLLVQGKRLSANLGYLLAGIVGTLLVVELYILSRSLGIPAFGPHAGHLEEIDGLGLLSKALELGLVTCLSLLLLRIPDVGRQLRSKALLPVAGSLVVAIAMFASSLAGSTGVEVEDAQAWDAAQAGPLNVIRRYDEGATTSRDLAVSYLTVNVEIFDSGMQPATITIPAGQRVKLVLRNRGTAEYHYRVLGLVPEGMVFLAPEDAESPAEAPAGVSEAEHGDHHTGDVTFAPLRSLTTPEGVRVTGDRVHAWAPPGGNDTVIFTAPQKGTYTVQDPRHRDIVGELVVS